LPIAALVLAVGCNENSSTPVEAVTPGTANASGSPHFIANGTSCTQQGVNLVCSFKEAGLSAGASEFIQVSVSANAGYGCVNGGGSVPSDPKKSTSGNLTSSGTFTAGKNGNLLGTLTVSPLAANQVLDCPPGQTATLISVTYFAPATINDFTSGASFDVTSF
jgi:hypothetical protein